MRRRYRATLASEDAKIQWQQGPIRWAVCDGGVGCYNDRRMVFRNMKTGEPGGVLLAGQRDPRVANAFLERVNSS